MDIIDLKQIPAGAAVEIIRADFLPVRQTETAYNYLCLDAQERLVTTAGTSRLVGGVTVAEVTESLKNLGFSPFSAN